MVETPQRLRSQLAARKRHHSQPHNMINTHALQEKLVKEMLALSKQREEMEIGASSVDFSMLQTYKEMIRSRQLMLKQLEAEQQH